MNLSPSEIFKVLSVDTRIRIIELLKSRGTMCSKDIAEELGLTQAAISQHLKVLRLAGLVRNERKGYWIPYTIDEKVLENCRCIMVEVCKCECQGTNKIKEHKLDRANLETLEKYKKELECELKNVRESISKMKKRKNR